MTVTEHPITYKHEIYIRTKPDAIEAINTLSQEAGEPEAVRLERLRLLKQGGILDLHGLNSKYKIEKIQINDAHWLKGLHLTDFNGFEFRRLWILRCAALESVHLQGFSDTATINFNELPSLQVFEAKELKTSNLNNITRLLDIAPNLRRVVLTADDFLGRQANEVLSFPYRINLSTVQRLIHNSSIDHLSVQNFYIEADGSEAEITPRDQALPIELNLSFSTAYRATFRQLLTSTLPLTRLNFSNVSLWQGFTNDDQHLVDPAEGDSVQPFFPQLMDLDISHSPEFSPSLARLLTHAPNLEALNLEGAHAKNQLKGHRHDHLQVLNLSGCSSLKDEQLRTILSQYSNLTHLKLRGCHRITADAFRAFDMNQVMYLDISHCSGMTKADIKALLNRATHLEGLEMEGSTIRPGDLFDGLILSDLHTVNFRDCVYFTDSTIAALICATATTPEHWESSLVAMDLRNCNQVTGAPLTLTDDEFRLTQLTGLILRDVYSFEPEHYETLRARQELHMDTRGCAKLPFDQRREAPATEMTMQQRFMHWKCRIGRKEMELFLRSAVTAPLEYEAFKFVTDDVIRQKYQALLDAYKAEALQQVQNGVLPYDAAASAMDARNHAKEAIRAWGDPLDKYAEGQRNIGKYGHKLGPHPVDTMGPRSEYVGHTDPNYVDPHPPPLDDPIIDHQNGLPKDYVSPAHVIDHVNHTSAEVNQAVIDHYHLATFWEYDGFSYMPGIIPIRLALLGINMARAHSQEEDELNYLAITVGTSIAGFTGSVSGGIVGGHAAASLAAKGWVTHTLTGSIVSSAMMVQFSFVIAGSMLASYGVKSAAESDTGKNIRDNLRVIMWEPYMAVTRGREEPRKDTSEVAEGVGGHSLN